LDVASPIVVLQVVLRVVLQGVLGGVDDVGGLVGL